MTPSLWFESNVNSQRYKTNGVITKQWSRFESNVNSQRYKTTLEESTEAVKFESNVNSQRYKTECAMEAMTSIV